MALHPGRMVEEPERQPYIRWTTCYDFEETWIIDVYRVKKWKTKEKKRRKKGKRKKRKKRKKGKIKRKKGKKKKNVFFLKKKKRKKGKKEGGKKKEGRKGKKSGKKRKKKRKRKMKRNASIFFFDTDELRGFNTSNESTARRCKKKGLKRKKERKKKKGANILFSRPSSPGPSSPKHPIAYFLVGLFLHEYSTCGSSCVPIFLNLAECLHIFSTGLFVTR